MTARSAHRDVVAAIALCALVGLLLQACSLTPAAPVGAPADPAATLAEPILPPSDAGAAPLARPQHQLLVLPSPPGYPGQATVIQDLHATRGDASYVAQAILSVSAERVVLLLTLPLGPRIATIDWSERGIEVRRDLDLPMADLVAPEDVLADVVLTYWPEAALRRSLRDSRNTLVVEPDGRRVMRDGVPVVEVRRDPGDPWNGRATLDNHLLGYRLTIVSRTVPGA